MSDGLATTNEYEQLVAVHCLRTNEWIVRIRISVTDMISSFGFC